MPGQSSVKLSESQVNGIAYIEQTWWTTGAIPTQEKVAETLGVTVNTVKKWFSDEDFRNALITRGVSLDTERDSALLTILQLTVANAILNFHDKRSLREKLSECGVNTQQYHAWMRTPAFRKYVENRAKEMFQSSDHLAYAALVDSVESKDQQALKLYFEMRGIYNPRVQVDVNVDMVLTRVVEIVAKHVKDPAILEAIARDIEYIDQPPPLQELPQAVDANSTELDSMNLSMSGG